MKNIFYNFMLFITLLNCSLLFSSNVFSEEKISKNDNIINKSAMDGELLVGKIISGKFVITIEKQFLLDKINNQWKLLGFDYQLEDAEIVLSIPENDASIKVYILQLRSKDHNVTVGYVLNSVREEFYLSDDFNVSAGISCASTNCQFGCAPASLINPKTRKAVLTCSSCTSQCTKTASIH